MANFPRGRTGAALLLTVGRELTAGDILRLRTDTKPRSENSVTTVQKLSRTHHMAAQLIARGYSYIEVAKAVGRTSQRIGDMARNDPSFQWLVSYYSDMVDEQLIDETVEFTGQAKDIARLSLEEIQDRLDDPVKRGQIPIGELRMLAGDMLTRTVLPPKVSEPSVKVPVHITFNAGNRDISGFQGQEIDGEASEIQTLPAPKEKETENES